MKQNPAFFDVVIGGGGLAGLTMALALAHYNITCAVIEPGPDPKAKDNNNAGRTTAIMQKGLAFYKQINMPVDGTPLEELAIIDQETECIFQASDVGVDHFALNISNTTLRYRLWEAALTHKNITLLQGHSVRNWQADTHQTIVVLDDECNLNTSLLIGADGARSSIRRLANIKTHHSKNNQKALTTLLTHDDSHNNRSSEFHLDGGPFTLVPCADNTTALVWMDYSDKIDAVCALSKKDFLNILQDNARGVLGNITDFSPVQSWPVSMQFAKSLIAPRLVLIAEAAHNMPPLGAQGFNTSLRDIEELCRLLTHHKSIGMDIGSQTILNEYQQHRRIDNTIRSLGTQGLNFSLTHAPQALTPIRRGMLSWIAHNTSMQKTLMKAGLA